jgi:serine/threonine-protein phosphatase 2A regulatory subunit B'
MLFLTKDRTLAIHLLEGLLKYWPFANCIKETLFLTELQEVLEVCEVDKVEPLIGKLFKRIVKCIGGIHLQVADRAMCFFENDYFLNILKTYKEKTFPMLVPIIVDLADNHWHKILQESLIALKTILKEIDPLAFDEAQKMSSQAKKQYAVKQDEEDRKNLDKKWDKLNSKIKEKNPDFEEPSIPFQSSNLIKDFNELYSKIYDKEKFIQS